MMEWSEAKQEVFAFNSNIVVSAGAGSGKTAALVELYVRLVTGETRFPRPLSVEEIVAITFTDKAAVEMKARVRHAMERRQAEGDRSAPWKKLLRELPAAPISTFHAFCSRLLRENPAEAGVDPAFVLLDDLVAGGELQATLDEVIEEELDARNPDLRLLLGQYPLSATGRGRGLREHLLDLRRKRAASGQDDSTLLLMAQRWHEEAARVFQSRAHDLMELAGDVERVLAGKELSFHRKLRQFPGLCHSGQLSLEESDTSRLLAAMGDCIGGNWGKERPLKEELEGCLDALSAAWWQCRSTPHVAALLFLAARVEDAYRRRKDRRGGLDFDDLQEKARHVLKNHAALREEYRARFPVVMVDEFQDTNPLQKELLELLCGETQRLFIVGDPKQSIYLFRGADVSVFGRAQAEMAVSGGRNLYFRESFRSRQGIVRFVNGLFCQVMAQGSASFELCYGEQDHMDAKREDWDSVPCVELLTLQEESGGDNRSAEAAAIARKILDLVSGEAKVAVYTKRAGTAEKKTETGEASASLISTDSEPDFVPRPPRFGDIALLFRRFTHLKTFERELRRHGIPYYVVKGKGFYRCQEVLDLLNFLRYLEFGGDLTSLVAVLRSPLCGVSDETLYLLSRLDGGIGGWEKICSQSLTSGLPPSLLDRIDAVDRSKLHRMARLTARLRPLRDRFTLAELIEDILTATDFTSSLLPTFQGTQKAANLRKLIEFSRSFAGEGHLRGFVNYLNELVETEPTEAEAVIAAEGEDVVRIMTVHQSKGLEFPVVFIPELGAGHPADHSPVKYDETSGVGLKMASTAGTWNATLAYQAITGLQRRKEAAELKRLLYVATTRARDYLILSGEAGKNRGGPWREWVDAFISGDSDPLVKVTRGSLSVTGPTAAPLPPAGAGPGPCISAAEIGEGLRRSVQYHKPLPSIMTFSPTALEDYATCPRKYFYKGVMGLDEGLFAELLGNRKGRSSSAVAGMTPLEKGNLAHLLLERLDFSASLTAQREACLRIAGASLLSPEQKEVTEVIENVLSFAASPLGRHLAGKHLLREHPFTLKLTGDAVYLIKGAMDLVAVEGANATVYDYKYLEKKEADLDGYRFQLRTYMLALTHGWRGGDITGELLFLKGGAKEAVDCDPLQLESDLIRIMDEIRARSAEEEFSLREMCTGVGCAFRQRCLKR